MSELAPQTKMTQDEQAMNNRAVNFAQVLKDERTEMAESLKRQEGTDPDHLLGVAFSGGGIRSASVNLGLIQALAQFGFLKNVHYICGVSGGGYILGWLTSWIKRSGFEEVQAQLAPKAKNIPPKAATNTYDRFVEPHPIHYLRKYTSYLTPRMGLGSGDTLAMISIYLRNVLLNQVLVVAAAAAIIALMQRLFAPVFHWDGPLSGIKQVTALVIALACAVIAGILTGYSLDCLGKGQQPKAEPRWAGRASSLVALVMSIFLWLMLPTMFTKDFFAFSWVNNFLGYFTPIIGPVCDKKTGSVTAALTIAVIMLAMYIAGFLFDMRGKKDKLDAVSKNRGNIIFAALFAILIAILFLAATVFGFYEWLHEGTLVVVSAWYVMLGLPAIMVAFALSSYVHIGILGDVFPDAKREWLGRFAGYYLFYAAITAILMLAALRGPIWMHLLFKGVGSTAGTGAWLKWILPGGWLFTVLTGVLGGASSHSTGNKREDKSWLDFLVKIAPPVFLIGMLMMISWGVYAIASQQDENGYLAWTKEETSSVKPPLFEVTSSTAGGSILVYAGTAADVPPKPKSVINHRNATWLTPTLMPTATLTPTPTPSPSPTATPCSSPSPTQETNPATNPGSSRLFYVFIVSLLVALVLLWRLDANEFSMHLFYRNRLVRAFLGASHVVDGQGTSGSPAPNDRSRESEQRRPSPFTGFALDDDFPLQELCSWWPRVQKKREKIDDEKTATAQPGDRQYDGPYPIWATALNMTTGEDLAWQKRKAASFIYSPLYCGWDYAGKHPALHEQPDADRTCNETSIHDTGANRCKYAYRGTGDHTLDGKCERIPYTGLEHGPTIGTAMAASGAAISPNWGYHTSPAVAALLAIFNVRIGWWTGNPRRDDAWKNYAPGAYYLGAELAGATNDSGKYVYLSDGGHFENLGVYELVRRKVKYIISCDADSDPGYAFDDLANAVEKCRRDFGVEIDINTSAIKPDKKKKVSGAHFAVGTIKYPGDPDKGTLLFLKSSLTGDESADVLGQHTTNPSFPHDTTVNQFFNETQFEVYRALGQHMFQTIAEVLSKPEWPQTESRPTVKDFFDRLGTYRDEQKRRGAGALDGV